MAPLVAVVTGASSGIGAAAARRLHRDGLVVYAGARRTERMADLAGLGVTTVGLDVTDDASMTALVNRVLAEQGRIDVLLNNAGYGSYGALEEVPAAEARAQLEVNLFGLARMSQLVIPHMRRARRGRILNVSSIGGRFGEPLGAWYHASKFAVEGLSDSLRLELRDFGIQVVVIEPGAVNTEWGGTALDQAARYSGDGPYAGHVAAMRRLYGGAERVSPGPEVIAEAISKAVHARRPRPRYAAPFTAKALILTIRALPTQALDVVIRRITMGGGIDVDQYDPVAPLRS